MYCELPNNHQGEHIADVEAIGHRWDDKSDFVACLAFCNKPYAIYLSNHIKNNKRSNYCLDEIGHKGECGKYTPYEIMRKLENQLIGLNQKAKEAK